MANTEIPLMDAPSVDQHTTPADVRRPGVSRRVRLAVLTGALAVFGVAGTVLWQAFTAKPTPQADASVLTEPTDAPITFAETATSSARLPVPDPAAVIDQPVMIQPAETPPVPHAQAVALIDAVRADIVSVREELAPLDTALTALQTRVAKLEHTTVDQATYEAIIAALRTDLAALGSKVDALNKKPSRRRARVARKPAPAPTLPFSAEAIDWWGGEPSLVVRNGAQRQFLSPGQRLGGWRLAEVDRPGQFAVFERDGQRVRLGVSP